MLSRLVATMNDSRAALLRAVDPVDNTMMHVRAADGAWSIGEVLNHLADTERRITGLVQLAVSRASTADAPVPHNSRTLEDVTQTFGAKAGERSREKLSSPVAPEHGVPRSELLASLAASRAAMMAALDGADDLDLSTTVYPHPFFGELDTYEWLLFVARHEDRHRAQIERIRAALPISA